MRPGDGPLLEPWNSAVIDSQPQTERAGASDTQYQTAVNSSFQDRAAGWAADDVEYTDTVAHAARVRTENIADDNYDYLAGQDRDEDWKDTPSVAVAVRIAAGRRVLKLERSTDPSTVR
jgi:hypothetical protein